MISRGRSAERRRQKDGTKPLAFSNVREQEKELASRTQKKDQKSRTSIISNHGSKGRSRLQGDCYEGVKS